MFVCFVCSEEFESVYMYPDEDDNVCCPNCGMKYIWEEGIIPVLTDDDYNMIYKKRMKEKGKENE